MKRVFVLAVTVCLVLSILSGTAYALSVSDIVGTWRLISVVEDNKTLTPEEAGGQVILIYNAEGNAVMIPSVGNPSLASWSISGDSVFLISERGEEIPFHYTEGNLITEESGRIMTFERINDKTDIVEDSPVKTDVIIDDFIGSWTGAYMEVSGFFVKLTDINTEMTLTITNDTLEMRGCYGEEEFVETFACAMDGYHCQFLTNNGVARMLALYENGMIAMPNYDITAWFINDNGKTDGQWKCAACGHEENKGKFCTECGAMKPQPGGWTCSCGEANEGKFCTECGQPKPSDTPAIYRCSNCDWEPEDPQNPPKFCPDCGDAFDENDMIR